MFLKEDRALRSFACKLKGCLKGSLGSKKVNLLIRFNPLEPAYQSPLYWLRAAILVNPMKHTVIKRGTIYLKHVS